MEQIINPFMPDTVFIKILRKFYLRNNWRYGNICRVLMKQHRVKFPNMQKLPVQLLIKRLKSFCGSSELNELDWEGVQGIKSCNYSEFAGGANFKNPAKKGFYGALYHFFGPNPGFLRQAGIPHTEPINGDNL